MLKTDQTTIDTSRPLAPIKVPESMRDAKRKAPKEGTPKVGNGHPRRLGRGPSLPREPSFYVLSLRRGRRSHPLYARQVTQKQSPNSGSTYG